MRKLILISAVILSLVIGGYLLSMKIAIHNSLIGNITIGSVNSASENNSNLITCDNVNIGGRPLRVQQPTAGSLLTQGPTDPQLIKFINTGNSMRAADSRFTYLQNLNTRPIPVIAPANGTLIYIVYKTREDLGPTLGGADYDLEFAVDCKTIYRINHITNPSDAIRALSRLKEPAKLRPGMPINEQDTIPTQEFLVKAGDQLGTTTGTPTAHNWDFAVFVDRQATCPYNLLPQSQRLRWLSLLSPTDKPVPGTPCNVSGGM